MPRKRGKPRDGKSRDMKPAKQAVRDPLASLKPHISEIEDWFHCTERAICSSIESNQKVTSSTIKAAKQKLHELSLNCDEVGIKFRGPALHFVYYQSKFTRRGLLLLSMLELMLQTPKISCHLSDIVSVQELRVASIGGGPGTDSAGLVWFNRLLRKKSTPIQCMLFDAEPSWKRHTSTLNSLFEPDVSCEFDECDVTTSLETDIRNMKLRALAKTFHLYVFSYVVHETSSASAKVQDLFYTELALLSNSGTIFLFLDVMGHCTHVFQRIQTAMSPSCQLIPLPLNSLKTSAMILVKS